MGTWTYLKNLEKRGIDIEPNYFTLVLFYNRGYSIEEVLNLFGK